MSRLTRDGTAEPVSRDQILGHERAQGNIHFPCSADHEQDWQPYPVDPYSCYMCDHTHIYTVNGAPFSYRNRTPHLYEIFLLRFVIWLLRAYKYRQLCPWLARNGPETFRHLYNIKKIGWSVDRYKKGVNTGVFASKYNFGISNLRYEASRCHIATCSKRKSA